MNAFPVPKISDRVMKCPSGCTEKFLNAIASLDIVPWAGIKSEDLKVTRIAGGLTNILYKVSLTDREDQSSKPELLVRIFGAVDGLIDREKENLILERLSECGISPRLIAKYDWGRLEEFLSTRSPLQSGVDMVRITPDCDMVSLIAGCLRKLHSVNLGADSVVHSANVFAVIERWLDLSRKYSHTIKSSPKCPGFTPPSIEVLTKEVEWIGTFIENEIMSHPRIRASKTCHRLSQEVLCHNDMLAGNLLFDESDKSLRLIDFEYSGYNYAIADISNVCAAVCESIMLSGQPQDVGKNFPSDKVQLHFVQEYLGSDFAIPTEDYQPVLLVIRAFAMAEELRWTIWGILQSQQAAVGGFDYCMYYNSRFHAYHEYKDIVQTKLISLD